MIDQRIALQIAARAQCDVRTAKEFLRGRESRHGCLRARLHDAAKELGIERPSAPPPEPPKAA